MRGVCWASRIELSRFWLKNRELIHSGLFSPWIVTVNQFFTIENIFIYRVSRHMILSFAELTQHYSRVLQNGLGSGLLLYPRPHLSHPPHPMNHAVSDRPTDKTADRAAEEDAVHVFRNRGRARSWAWARIFCCRVGQTIRALVSPRLKVVY